MLSDSAHVKISDIPSDDVDTAPWLQRRDLLVAALMLVFWLITLTVPERHWMSVAHWLSRRRLAGSAKLTDDELRTIQVVVGSGKDKPAWIENSFRRDWLAHKYLSWIQLLAGYRPWRWRPKPRLVGRHHLNEALSRQKGVILLTANFAHKDLNSKAALAQAGYWASHLVRDSHGFAESLIGRRLLNPIYAAIERRYLRERLVFSGTNTKQVNAMIRAQLRQNRPILVTVTPLGRRIEALPFLHGRIKIATGALNFACEAGAEVLPLFTIRKPDGDVETIIEPPLDRPEGATRSEIIRAMLEDYVPRLETYVAQNPEQFAFPISDRHGRALIEPVTSPVRENAPEEDPAQQTVPELS